MIRLRGLQDRNQKRGTAMMEFAMAMPLMLMLMFGAVDFARVYYHVVTLANAAGAGAFYGAQDNIRSGHYSGMSQIAKDDAKDLTVQSSTAVTATGTRYCECPVGYSGSATNRIVDCLTGSCPGYGFPRAFVQVTTSENFKTVVPWPGVPKAVTVGRRATLRAQ